MKTEQITRLIETADTLTKSGRVYTRTQIANLAGLKLNTVYRAVSQKLINFKPKSAQILRGIEEEIAHHTPFYKIREKLGITPTAFYQKAHGLHISLNNESPLSEAELEEILSSLKDEKSRSIANFALQGFSLTKIGEITSLTKEGVRVYIAGLGIYNTWLEKREAQVKEEKERREQTRSNLLLIIKSHLDARLNSLSRIERRALEYHAENYVGHTKGAAFYDKIVKLLYSYEKALNSGSKPTLAELAESSGIIARDMSRIIKALNLKPFHKLKKHLHTSEEKRRAIASALNLPYLTQKDVSRLSGLSLSPLRENISSQLNEPTKSRGIKLSADREKPAYIQYSKASEIYEALDNNFSVSETALLTDSEENAVRYSLKHRHKLAPKIISALRIIFPKAKIDKPYYKPQFEEIYK